MKEILATAERSKEQNTTLFLAMDTESECVKFKKNQCCVIQFAYKVEGTTTRTIVIQTDFCMVSAKRDGRESEKQLLTV